MGVRGRASGESGPFSAELGAGLTDSEGVQAFRGALRTSLPVVVVSTRTFSDVVQENERLSADNLLQQFASSRTDTETKHARPNMRTEFVAPRSAQEELLARIWQDLLGLDRVGVNDNFFELGGDSVVSIQMIARAAKVRVRLTARQVFENQTISELAQSLGVHTGVQAEQGVVTGEAPPTPIQSWFFDTHSQTRNHFNQAMMLRLRTPVPAGVLAKACDALLAHHDSLRQRFEIVDGRWISRYIHSQEKQSVFQTCSLATVADADLPKAIEVEATQAHASLNVEQGPLMRVVYFDCGSHRPARLLLVVHHLAIDLASWRILVDDLQTACEQTIAGKSIVLPPKTSSFKSWAEQLRLHTVKGGFAAELTHWQTVESVDTVILVNACSTERQPVTTAAAVETYISAEQTTKLLHEVSTRFGAQPIEVLLTLLARTLHDWTGSSSFPVELEGLGREPLFPHLDVSRTTGWFTPLYPVLAAWNPSADWRSAIEANREHLRNIPHKGVGYGALRYFDAHAELGKRTPQIGFLYFGQTDQTQEHSTLFHRASEGCGVPYGDHLLLPHLLSVEAAITGGSLQIRWIYSQNQFEASTIQRLATFFERALEELLDAGVAQHTPAALAQDAEEFGWNDSDLDEIAAALQKTLEL
jgi:non-ribosomal peptide synthase protein (TIGR01720 family)